MTSENTVQVALQTAIRGLAAFSSADVVINDWDVLNMSGANAPYVVIENSPDLDARQDTMTPRTRWNIPITLVEYVGTEKYKAVMDNLCARRQALVDMFNTGSNRSASIAGVTIDRIRQDGGLIEIYDPGWTAEQIQGGAANPAFVAYRLVAETETF